MNGDTLPTGVDVLGPPVTFPFTGVPFGAVEPLPIPSVASDFEVVRASAGRPGPCEHRELRCHTRRSELMMREVWQNEHKLPIFGWVPFLRVV